MGLTDFITDTIKDKAKDYAVDKASEKIEEHMDKSGKAALKKDNKVGRFFVSLIWFAVYVIITLLVMAVAGIGFFQNPRMALKQAMIIGIIASLVLILLTILIPYLRRGSWTRWWGFWLPLGDTCWWTYLLITD